MNKKKDLEMARISENKVREIEGALEFVVPMHSPHRMLVRVVKVHFPNAPSDMRWSISSSVRTRDQGQSRTTFAGYPEKLSTDAREDEISANSVPCVLDMALNTPWYNAILLECESPWRGWFVDLIAHWALSFSFLSVGVVYFLFFKHVLFLRIRGAGRKENEKKTKRKQKRTGKDRKGHRKKKEF